MVVTVALTALSPPHTHIAAPERATPFSYFLPGDLCLTGTTDQSPEQGHGVDSCLACLIIACVTARLPALVPAMALVSMMVWPDRENIWLPDRFYTSALARAPPQSCPIP